jgi:hypothetical protein
VNYNNKSSSLAVGISFYNDRECLRRCIKSLQLWNEDCLIDKVILVDGKYKGFNSKSRLSGDYSRLLISKYREIYPDKIHLCDAPNLLEWQKRQKYVNVAAKHKIPFLLVMDSDEYIAPAVRWRELGRELNQIMRDYPNGAGMFDVSMLDMEQNYRCYRPRLWYMPERMRYNEKHNQFRVVAEEVQPGRTLTLGQMIRGSSIELYHCHQGCRPQKRHEQQLDYEYRLPTLEA